MESLVDTSADVITSLAGNELLIAVLAAFLAYYFGLKAQRAVLKEQHKLSIHDQIWKHRDELQAALIEQSAHLGSFSTVCIGLRHVEQSKAIQVKGGRPAWEFDAEIRRRWQEYIEKASQGSMRVSEAFSKLHHGFEQTSFAYPELKSAFLLLKDEVTPLFLEQQTDLIPWLYQIDALTLVTDKGEKLVQDKIDATDLVERHIGMTAYLDDYVKLIQKELAGKLFDFEPEERKPEEGKVLTASGWKAVKPAKPSKKKAGR